MTLIITTLFSYLSLAVVYQFILAIASFWTKRTAKKGYKSNRYLILVPAYKEDAIIVDSTLQNLQVEYAKDEYDLVVIGDQLKASTITKLEYYGAHVLTVNFKNSTKAKALNHAVEVLSLKGYDAVIVLDADNIMHEKFLIEANRALDSGAYAIQGQRKAANFNNAIAVYDAIAENANTAMLCQGANNLNFSSKLSGSGMIFKKDIFIKTIQQVSAIGGFDKEMELILTKTKTFIKYWESAIIYDQKIDSATSYSKQRGRWLQAQYAFLLKHIGPSCMLFYRGNFDYFHKVVQLALPPRALIPVGLLGVIVLAILWPNIYLQLVSFAVILINVLTYVLVTPWIWQKSFFYKLIINLPVFIYSNLKALFFIPTARKSFIHTIHNRQSQV